ncbi:cytokine receptor common subunit beta isoform X2 [Xenopus laevis]|uniref:Cytokine receptor common subunit beta isoform X2 n=1 Tax=Xenopus laevis TaxID=8355 RepID=A0A8J1N095_XENLA|nr:cytokine receptor common subunit beta isoform X2 [Xenopus laevis]
MSRYINNTAAWNQMVIGKLSSLYLKKKPRPMMMGSPRDTWWLHILVYPLFFVQIIQGSALLDSLNCVNDYINHWKCEWKENVTAHKLLPMTLYKWNTLDSTRKPCVPSQHGEGPELRMSCIIYDTEFIINMNEYFTLLPKRDVRQGVTIVPAYNVRTYPPRGLVSRMLDNGTVILSWKSPVRSDFHLTILYQITYRRQDWEGWKSSASVNVKKKLNVSLSPDLFVPGSTNIFRVRTLPHNGEHPSGSWSKWSKELPMKIPEGDTAAPRNLQCKYNGLTKMRCTWEVHKEVTPVVSYVLYYTEWPAGAKSNAQSSHNAFVPRKNSCLPNKKARNKPGVPYVMYSCILDLTPQQVHRSFSIQVRPLKEVKTFIPYQTVQPQPPRNLKVEEYSDSYMLRWSSPQPNTIKLRYQLCYWKEDDPECPSFSLMNVSDNVYEYYILGSDLKELSNYTAKVRSRSHGIYSGPWSDWSQRISWKNEKAADNPIIFIVTPICVLVLLACSYIGYKLIKRSQERWEVSLPNPSKSKLLSNYQLGFWQPGEFTYFTEEYSGDGEGPCICFPQSGQAQKAWDTEENAEEIVTKSNSTQLETCPILPPKADMAEDQHSIQDQSDAGETHSSTALPHNPPVEQATKLQHKSPYLLFTRAHSMSDLVGKKIQKSEYFTLPRPKGEIFGDPSKMSPSCRPVSAQEPLGYVFRMGAQQSFHPPENLVQKGHNTQCTSLMPVPSPSESQAPMEGPVLVITPDGTGPLKQIGDYCFFPGLDGSQEKLEVKKAQPSGHGEQQIIQNLPPHAIKAFKVMQRGYFALPQN